jgi:predicted translin family RNA/ssDNA-binding protein
MTSYSKRPQENIEPTNSAKKPTAPPAPTPSDPLQAYFTVLSTQNDLNNDLRERIIRLCREITRQSKRVISLLQRVGGGSAADDASLVRQAHEALVPIRADLKNTKEEIAKQDVWRHKTSWGGGVEEYIEAISFLHFVETGELLTLDAAAATMEGLPLHLSDYLGGIADLSGELMRVCVAAGGSNKPDVVRKTCAFVCNLQAAFNMISSSAGFDYAVGKKMTVLGESLAKMEAVCFQMKLRESEAFPASSGSLALDMGPRDDANDEQ